VKVMYEILDRIEMITIRQICEFTLKERTKMQYLSVLGIGPSQSGDYER